MKRQILIIIGAAIALTSCEKVIDIDYHSSEPLYVAEGILSQDKTTVTLTTTQQMKENTQQGHYVENALVVVSCKKEGSSDTLRYTRKGIYTSTYAGMPGLTYDIDIFVDGHHFTSSSTMQEAPVMKSLRFVWKEMLGERILFADLRIDDIPNQSNYYFMHLYRNGVGYRWAVQSDEHKHNAELQTLFSCTSQRDMDKGDEDALRDGDHIRLEVRSIDRRTYDYLYSLQGMDNKGSNPIANFTGGCLGYFSACHIKSRSLIFRLSETEEE